MRRITDRRRNARRPAECKELRLASRIRLMTWFRIDLEGGELEGCAGGEGTDIGDAGEEDAADDEGEAEFGDDSGEVGAEDNRVGAEGPADLDANPEGQLIDLLGDETTTLCYAAKGGGDAEERAQHS